MEVGILLFVRLVLAHLENSPTPGSTQCNVLADQICNIILRDTFTVVLTIWACLQLTWVTMLLVVQLVQISRAKTTFESMRGHTDQGSRASEAITAALTSGSTSMNGAQLAGPDASGESYGHGHHHREGFFAQWKKLLGLDTFLVTAQDGLEGRNRHRRGQNAFSQGIITNCRDFWCDPAPLFGRRDDGAAMLGGTVVNYARMYELPPRMKAHRSRGNGNDDTVVYTSVDSDSVV
ncbi:palmitoyltransferase akr1 [Trapelia coarctata]|nr:palmitoyltransferase akr1 [Trapelia coarctata]